MVACAAVLSGLVFGVPAGAIDGTEPITTAAGGNGNGSANNQLSTPWSIAVGPDESLYIADRENARIQKVSPDGSVTTVAGRGGRGAGNDQLDQPAGIALAPDGSLYIADTQNDRIQKIAPDGSISTVVGGIGEGNPARQVDEPLGIAVGPDGAVYVADSGNHRVQKFVFDGGVTTINTAAGIGGQGPGIDQLDRPSAVAVGADGTLYVVDVGNHRVRSVSPDGTVNSAAGFGGQGSGVLQLSNPFGVVAAPDGSLYVADSGNNRVQKVASDGALRTVTTVAGGNGQGPGDDQLWLATGVGLGPDGSLYITDTFNRRVLKLSVPDVTDPTVTIRPADGVALANRGAASTDFSCNDIGSSSLASCTATLNGIPVANGTTIDTTIPSTKVLTVTATDGAGNTHTQSSTFSIEPALTGAYRGATGIEASIARLYLTVFDRQPDADGHAYWVGRAADGMTLRDMAAFFVVSPEFQATYGDVTNAEFVDLIYRNVLNRPGDAGGVAFWNTQLDEGMERSVVVLQFAESIEFKILTGTS